MFDRAQIRATRPRIRPHRLGGAKLAFLTLLAAGVSHAALALPSGASVQSGSVGLTRAPNLLTINQSSQDAIINWSSFSIEAAGTVQFNNGSGATLNRVTGSDVSTINGLLNATGSVYLINPNGVIIGKTGQVNVGGTFVASTLDLEDDNLDGATKTFSGSSGASVINLGSISALGGDVVLIANNVKNTGSISAPNGDIGLLAGSQVLISDVATDNGRFAVQIGGSGASVVNAGALQAAIVELRANQGNVYALAGNTTGVINAMAVSTRGGEVFLVAEGGDTVVSGTITAVGPVGSIGGQVTTSGSKVSIGGANVTAGNWTIQQDHFVLTPEAATALAANLATTDITVETTGAGVAGDISLASSMSWSGDNSLEFSAARNIVFQDGVTISNTDYGSLILAADNKGRGVGTVLFGAGASVATSGSVLIYYDPAGDDKMSVNSYSYTNPTDFSSNVSAKIGLTSYMLVNTVYDLQNIQNNLSGDYALGRNIDAGVAASWNGGAGFTPIGSTSGVSQPPSPFNGLFKGNEYTIQNLNINQPDTSYVGLFADIGQLGEVFDVSLKGGSITGTGFVGAIAGRNDGGVFESYANLPVTGLYTVGLTEAAGGLVGYNTGTMAVDRAAGNVAGYGSVGGLVGYNSAVDSNSAWPGLGTIEDSSATGNVSAAGFSYVGGLVGQSESLNLTQNSLSNSAELYSDHASGNVTGTQYVGGLAGSVNGTFVYNSYASGSVYAPGGSAAGGLIGIIEGTSNATVQYSHASGSVSGSAFAGGLIGYDSPASAIDSIYNVYATGSVNATAYGGGLIGYFSGSGQATNAPTLTNAYATGNVSGSGSLGGLIGFNSGTVTYAYWNTNTTGQSTDAAQATTPGDPTTGSIGLSGVDFWSAVKALPSGF